MQASDPATEFVVGDRDTSKSTNVRQSTSKESDMPSNIDEDEIPPSDFYSDFIAANPWTMWTIALISIIAFMLLGLIVTYTVKGGFTIGGAAVGFEARGTPLAGKILAMQHIKNYECKGTLSLTQDGTRSRYYQEYFIEGNEDPEYDEYDTCYEGYIEEDRRRRRRERRERRLSSSNAMPVPDNRVNNSRELSWSEYGRKYDPDLVSSGLAYDVVAGLKTGASVIFKSDTDLYSLETIKGMCDADNDIQSFVDWSSICVTTSYTTSWETYEKCLPSRSIGNYIAAYYNVTDCSALTSTHISDFKTLLLMCRPLYDSKALVGNCWNWAGGTTNGTYIDKYNTASKFGSCSLTTTAEKECARYNAVYDIFFALAESDWLSSGVDEPLTYAQIVQSNEVDDPDLLKALWDNIIKDMIGQDYDGSVVISATAGGNIRGLVFNEEIGAQISLSIYVFLIVYVLILYHTGSFWIATCGFFQIFMAFFWGYTLYSVVIWRSFFPFLNLISLFLIIGIGADDLFVYVDAWKQSFTFISGKTPLANRLSWTMRRAGGAMLVTSITTASSFLANAISPITALKCFGMFTAMVIISDFLLMLLFVPSIIALHYTTFSVTAGKIQFSARESGASDCLLPTKRSEKGIENDSHKDKNNNDDDDNDNDNDNDKDKDSQNDNEKVDSNTTKRMYHHLYDENEAKQDTIGGGVMVATVENENNNSATNLLEMSAITRLKDDAMNINENVICSQPTSSKPAGIGEDYTLVNVEGEIEASSSFMEHQLAIERAAIESGIENCACNNCCCCVTLCDIDYCAIPTEINKSTNKLKLRWSEGLFEKYIGPTIVHPILRYVFLAICIAVTAYLGQYATQLSKPSTDYMQLLSVDHPLEVYAKTTQFYFDVGNGQNFQFLYEFVFGLVPIDNGDGFNPYDRGTAVYKTLDIASSESQEWLYTFCSRISTWEYSPQSTLDLDTNLCTMYWFREWMEHSCAATGSSGSGPALTMYPSRSTCCGYTSNDFPFARNIFQTCINDFANYWGSSDRGTGNMRNHGLWFDDAGNLKVMVIWGESTLKYSNNYETVDSYYSDLKQFFVTNNNDAPKNTGLARSSVNDEGSFAYTQLRFYALQQAIADGAIQSAGLSTILAVIVLLVMTKRIMSSFFAAIEIACVVLCVTGVFVQLEWELNVVESVVFSLSVGLACDFAAHLAHAFNHVHIDWEHLVDYSFPNLLCDSNTGNSNESELTKLFKHIQLSTEKAIGSLTELGVTIVMGMITTFMAGVVLINGTLYFFQQFGTFLMTLMAFSLAFAFLFLIPILSSIGWIDRIIAKRCGTKEKLHDDDKDKDKDKDEDEDEDNSETDYKKNDNSGGENDTNTNEILINTENNKHTLKNRQIRRIDLLQDE